MTHIRIDDDDDDGVDLTGSDWYLSEVNWTYSFILLTDEHQNIEESVHGNDVGNDKSMEVLKTRLFLVDFMTGDFKF